MFLDNIDHLEPKIQRRAVDVVGKIADLANARTIVAIRPLTWEKSIHAYILQEEEPHWGPSPGAVVQDRMKEFGKQTKLDHETERIVSELTRVFTDERRYPLMSRMFFATCGLSVRAAQQNFANFLSSPLLSALVTTLDGVASLRVSEFARAFFFGRRDSMEREMFDHLYSADGDRRPEYRLIKPRVLDFVCRLGSGASTFRYLSHVLAAFGYSEDLIRRAFDEMLRRNRPLIWSYDGYVCSDLDSPARVAATPMGWGYYNELFGEYFYDEVCIAKSQDDVVSPRDVYKFHQELTEEDLREIRIFRRERGKMYYELYPRDECSLSLIHWKRMLVGLQRRVQPSDLIYDPQRENWIRDRVWGEIPPPERD